MVVMPPSSFTVTGSVNVNVRVGLFVFTTWSLKLNTAASGREVSSKNSLAAWLSAPNLSVAVTFILKNPFSVMETFSLMVTLLDCSFALSTSIVVSGLVFILMVTSSSLTLSSNPISIGTSNVLTLSPGFMMLIAGGDRSKKVVSTFDVALLGFCSLSIWVAEIVLSPSSKLTFASNTPAESVVAPTSSVEDPALDAVLVNVTVESGSPNPVMVGLL